MPSPGPIEIVVILVIFVMVVAVPFVLIVALARGVFRARPAVGPPHDPALDTLRTRFATGDIDEVEFQRLRSVLQRR